MFRTLLLKEIRDHLHTFRFSAALITLFVLITVSIWALGEDFARRRDLHNQLSESYAQSASEVIVPSHIMPTVQRPPSALSIFAQGEDGHLGNAVRITRWQIPDSAANNFSSNQLLASMPTFDVLTIIIIALSLFGVLLSYDALSGERERGTLKLICAYQPKRGIIFSVKFVAGAIVLAIPFLLSFICALVILHLIHGITFSAIQWLAIFSVLLAGVLYGAAFIALGLISSAFSNRSSTSLALALLLWALVVFLIPSLGQSAAPAIKPLLPPQEISKLSQTTSHELREKKRAFIENNNLNMSSEGDSNIGGEAPFYFDGAPEWFRDVMKYIGYYEPLYQQRAEQIWALTSKHLLRKKEQFDLGCLLTTVSPAYHARKALTSLSRTDYAAFADFMEQCRRYRQALLDNFRNKDLFDRNINLFFSRRTMDEMQTREQFDLRSEDRRRRYAAGEAREKVWGMGSLEPLSGDFAPAFQYQGSGPDIEGASWPIAALAITVILAFSFGFVAFIRYDVR